MEVLSGLMVVVPTVVVLFATLQRSSLQQSTSHEAIEIGTNGDKNCPKKSQLTVAQLWGWAHWYMVANPVVANPVV